MKTSLRPFQTKEKAKLLLMPVKIYYTSKTKPLLDNELFVTVLFSKSQSCMQKNFVQTAAPCSAEHAADLHFEHSMVEDKGLLNIISTFIPRYTVTSRTYFLKVNYEEVKKQKKNCPLCLFHT